MPKINILLSDVCGLNATTKRAHFFTGTNCKIISKEYPLWYYGDSPISQAKGVVIGFARRTRFTLERRVDPEGCFLFLRGKLNGAEVSLANVYGPNKNSIKYLMGPMAEFMEFKKRGAIMVGDFNLCLELKMNSTLHAQGIEITHRNK